MKNNFLFWAGLCWIFNSPLLSAQRSTELGFWGGSSFYLGDLAPDYPPPDVWSAAYGLSGTFGVNRFVYFRLQGIHGSLRGADAFTHNTSRDWSFSSGLSELALQVIYHPVGKGRRSVAGLFRKWQFSPYVFWGMGATWLHSRKLPPLSGEIHPDQNDDLLLINLPMGGGLRADLFRRLSLSVEAGWRMCFSDQLDGVHELGRADTNDWYVLTGIGISYILQAEVDRKY